MSYWDLLPLDLQKLVLKYKNYTGPEWVPRFLLMMEIRKKTRSVKNFCDTFKPLVAHQVKTRHYRVTTDKARRRWIVRGYRADPRDDMDAKMIAFGLGPGCNCHGISRWHERGELCTFRCCVNQFIFSTNQSYTDVC